MGTKSNDLIHDNCEELSIWAFYKILNEGDLNYLKIDKNSDVDETTLNNAWTKIINEYEELSGDQNQLIIWRLRLVIASLKARLQRVSIGVNLYFKSPLKDELKNELIEKLKTDKVIIKGNTTDEIKRINKQLQSMQTKIKLKEAELNSMTPEQGEGQDIEEQLYNIEKITEAKYKIEPKQTSVKRYLIISKDAKRIIEQQKVK